MHHIKLSFLLIVLFPVSQLLAQSEENFSNFNRTVESALQLAELSSEYQDKSSPTYIKLALAERTISQFKSHHTLDIEALRVLEVQHQKIRQMLNLPSFDLSYLNIEQLTVEGRLSGYVVDEETGEPIGNAVVRLYTESGALFRSVYTDHLGRYFFAIAPGNYVIEVRKWYSQYITELYEDVECSGGLFQGCELSDASLVTVMSDDNVRNINFSLAKQPKISGSVIDADSGLPLSAYVSVYDETEVFQGGVYSDLDGNYEIAVDPHASYYLVFEKYAYFSEMFDGIKCGNFCNLSNAQPVQVDNENVTEIDASLMSYFKITGRLIDEVSQEGLAGDYQFSPFIIITDANGYTADYLGSEDIDAEGRWSSAALSPGSYKIRSEYRGYLAASYSNRNCMTEDYSSCNLNISHSIVVGDSQNTNGIRLLHEKGSTVSGRVMTVDGVGISSVDVHIYNEYGNEIERVRSDSEGYYQFENIGEGTLYAIAKSISYQSQAYLLTDCNRTECNPFDGQSIEVTGNVDRGNINFRLKELGEISGVVLDENDQPLAYASLVLKNASSNYYIRTNGDGEYVISYLEPGQYEIYAWEVGYQSVIYNNRVCEQQDCYNETGDTIVIANGSSRTNINFSLPLRSALQVNLTANGVLPLNDGTLTVYDASASEVVQHTNVPYYNQPVEIYLNPGLYYLVYENSQYHVPQVYGGGNCSSECIVTQGQRVRVRDNETTAVEMEIDHYFRAEGLIQTGSNNSYYSDRRIKRATAQGQLIDDRRAGYNGNFALTIKDSQPFILKASAAGFHEQLFDGVNCNVTECNYSQATVINPRINQVAEYNFSLASIRSVSGTVRDSFGTVLDGVSVRLINRDNGTDESTTTDASGHYSFTGIDSGNYVLFAKEGDYTARASVLNGNIVCESPCDDSQAEAIAIGNEAPNQLVDFAMPNRGSMKIQDIRYINGSPVDQVYLYFRNSEFQVRSYRWRRSNAGDLIYFPSDAYQLITSSVNGMATAYPNRLCSGAGTLACYESSDSIEIDLGQSEEIANFTIHSLGNLNLSLLDDETGDAVQSAGVYLYNSEFEEVAQVSSNTNGVYTINSVQAGEYYLYVGERNSFSRNSYVGQLYGDILCPRGIGIDCLISEGLPLSITNNLDLEIQMRLKRKAQVEVKVINSFTGERLESYIKIYDSQGNFIDSLSFNETTITTLPPGNYYLLANPRSYAYSPTGYPNSRCVNENIFECDSSLAFFSIPIDGQLDANISTNLEIGIEGTIVDWQSDEPLSGVIVDFWNAVNGFHAGAVVTNSIGRFSSELNSADYYLSTDINDEAYFDQVFNNKTCVEGPVSLDLCDVYKGEIITVERGYTDLLEIRMYGDSIFSDGLDE